MNSFIGSDFFFMFISWGFLGRQARHMDTFSSVSTYYIN